VNLKSAHSKGFKNGSPAVGVKKGSTAGDLKYVTNGLKPVFCRCVPVWGFWAFLGAFGGRCGRVAAVGSLRSGRGGRVAAVGSRRSGRGGRVAAVGSRRSGRGGRVAAVGSWRDRPFRSVARGQRSEVRASAGAIARSGQ
jgi:hypothetical protein